MTDDLEQKITARYRQASTEQPPMHVDQAVLAAARQAVKPRAFATFGNQWLAGGAMAAVVVLSVLLVVLMPEQARQPVLELDTYESAPAKTPAMTGESRQEQVDHVNKPAAEPAPLQKDEVRRERQQPATEPAIPAPTQSFKKVAPKRSATPPAAPPATEQEFMRQPQPVPMESDTRDAHPDAGQTPRFKFYDVLPEREVDVPAAVQRPAITGMSAMDAPDAFYLQAGSFQDKANALRQQAALRALDYVVTIEPVKVETTTWYRVRIGPFADAGARALAQQQLQARGIETQVFNVPRSATEEPQSLE